MVHSNGIDLGSDDSSDVLDIFFSGVHLTVDHYGSIHDERQRRPSISIVLRAPSGAQQLHRAMAMQAAMAEIDDSDIIFLPSERGQAASSAQSTTMI
ncbi:hypothetical protein ACLOJK_032644 [Asimina triloba]